MALTFREAEVSGRIRWGSEGPPEEAYSRVTDAARFAPLHDAATEMFDRLEAEYEVERVEGSGLDDELEERLTCARPSVRLSAVDPAAAPITVVFSDFPGLHIRFGRWSTDLFPVCGCDACDESAEDEIERLTMMVDSVTTGGFREVVRCPALPFVGDGWLKSEFWTPAAQSILDRFPRCARADGRRAPSPGIGLESVATPSGPRRDPSPRERR